MCKKVVLKDHATTAVSSTACLLILVRLIKPVVINKTSVFKVLQSKKMPNTFNIENKSQNNYVYTFSVSINNTGDIPLPTCTSNHFQQTQNHFVAYIHAIHPPESNFRNQYNLYKIVFTYYY